MMWVSFVIFIMGSARYSLTFSSENHDTNDKSHRLFYASFLACGAGFQLA